MKRDERTKARMKLENQGFSLLELLISIAVLVLIMVPLMSNFIQSMKLNKKAEKLQIQSNLAASIMEGLKASTIQEVLEEFNGSEFTFDIIPNPVTDVLRLKKVSEGVYEESNSSDEQSACFFAIHGIEAGGTAYDAFIELDAVSYQKEVTRGSEQVGTMNKYPMPQVINLDEKANGLVFSDGSTLKENTEGMVIAGDTLDEQALEAFLAWGTVYAEYERLRSPEYLAYLNSYNEWLDACEEAAMDGDPSDAPLTPDLPEPTLADLDLQKYTVPEEIKKRINKIMTVTVTDAELDFQIEYLCDWWGATGIENRIVHSIDRLEYARTLENVYLFYLESIFQQAHLPGENYSADRIIIRNNSPVNPVNFFVANQQDIDLNNPIRIDHQPSDQVFLFTDVNPYTAYVGGVEDLTVNSHVIKADELDRIFSITVRICEPDPANRYKNIYYTLESAKER